MTAYKEERYGGWLGWARWAKDKIAGMPSAVNRFYSEGRSRYLKEMDAVINNVVAIIGKGLTSAKAKVAEGKQKISEYVAELPDELKNLGEQAASDIQDKFDSLESSIDAKQDQLINDLAQKYNDNLKAVDARIEEMKAANKGLVDKVVGFVKGVIETIKKLKEMLTSLLSKIANVIGDIIADPIGFLGNLIKGIKMGFDKFVGNIMKHLISGLVKWLTGALGPMGITIPEDIFSLKGIFSLVMQVLGLTWDYFRRKAVKLLSEPVVKALEVGFEVFKIVKEKGVAGLWEYIKEQFSNLKEMVIEQIKSMIITQVITAGVKWIIGLLNPVGAFIKAAMAIYEIVKFFIERAAQIYEFVNSVVDSIADIVKGNLGGAAQKVEQALANSIPLIIGFLASLLGISGLAKKVQGVIKKVRKKIDRAIDKILLKAKKFAGKLLGKGKKVNGKVDHVSMAKDISKKLSVASKESDPKKAIQEKKILAGNLQKKYQPKLEKGIKLTIKTDENIKGVEQDGDIDFNIKIAPNTTTATAQASVSGQWPKGTQDDPIPIRWYKSPGDYPKIKGKGPKAGVTLPKTARQDKQSLKVAGSNFPSKGSVLSRKPGRSDTVKNNVYSRLRDLVSTGGWNITASPYAIDHVRDLQWKGSDAYDNLWPLDTAKNSGANSSKYQRATALYRNKPVTKTVGGWGTSKYFWIAEVVAPSSGHDKSNAVNDGNGSVPKKKP